LFILVCISSAVFTVCVTGSLASTSLENQVVPYLDLSKIFGLNTSTPVIAPTLLLPFLETPNKSFSIVLKSKPL